MPADAPGPVQSACDALEVLVASDADPLDADEARYAAAARAANTVRGYRSDWREFTSWCAQQTPPATPLPAAPATITRYLSVLARAGAKVGTMSRRLSALKLAHELNGHPDPTRDPRVIVVWEGIRREHAAAPEQAKPLMPPLLWRVLSACPTIWTSKAHPHGEPDLLGARDRALLLLGFVTALRRNELCTLTVGDLQDHEHGMIAHIRTSKTDQHGKGAIVVIPRGHHRCPVTALKTWLNLSGRDGHDEAPLFSGVSRGNKPLPRPLTPGALNRAVQRAITRAGHDPTGYSAHSLRAGFVTHAHTRGASDRSIARQTRHRSMATIGRYTRIENAWSHNAATDLGL